MRGTITIKQDGTVVTEVTEREGDNCQSIRVFTDSLGHELEETRTGPDCDSAEEVSIS